MEKSVPRVDGIQVPRATSYAVLYTSNMMCRASIAAAILYVIEMVPYDPVRIFSFHTPSEDAR